MTTPVPIRCSVTITMTVDIDITQQSALDTKLTQVVQDLKAQFPDKIVENQISYDTGFKHKAWKV